MNKTIRASIQFLIIIIPLAFLSCAELVVGSAAKAVTIKQEERSLGEVFDDVVDGIFKGVCEVVQFITKTFIMMKRNFNFLILGDMRQQKERKMRLIININNLIIDLIQ